MLMLPIWGSICDGQSQLGLFIDVVVNSVFWHSNWISISWSQSLMLRCWFLKPLTLMSMGEKFGMSIIFWYRSYWDISMERMIDEEDLKKKINSLLLVLLELVIFHLCLHQCQRGIFLEAWMLMILLWGSIVETCRDHYHDDMLHSWLCLSLMST